MKRRNLNGLLLGLAAIALLTADAWAHYHPRAGRFVQRDPASYAKGDVGRGQYADGLSLYQYTASKPIVASDPSGLKITHFDCCDKAQQAAIRAAHNAVNARLPIVRADIYKMSYAWVVLNHVAKTGRTSRNWRKEKSYYSSHRGGMLYVLDRMISGLSAGVGVECERKCKGDPDAYVPRFFRPWVDIHFCPKFFASSPSTQSDTFMHELSHVVAGTEDLNFGWLETGEILKDPQGP